MKRNASKASRVALALAGLLVAYLVYQYVTMNRYNRVAAREAYAVSELGRKIVEEEAADPESPFLYQGKQLAQAYEAIHEDDATRREVLPRLVPVPLLSTSGEANPDFAQVALFAVPENGMPNHITAYLWQSYWRRAHLDVGAKGVAGDMRSARDFFLIAEELWTTAQRADAVGFETARKAFTSRDTFICFDSREAIRLSGMQLDLMATTLEKHLSALQTRDSP